MFTDGRDGNARPVEATDNRLPAERIAENESVFRRLNEGIEAATDLGAPDATFLCECADPSCREVIRLTISEYERIRADDTRIFRRLRTTAVNKKPELSNTIPHTAWYRSGLRRSLSPGERPLGRREPGRADWSEDRQVRQARRCLCGCLTHRSPWLRARACISGV